jgi:mutator protein MutT
MKENYMKVTEKKKMRQVTRLGAYAVALYGNNILLIEKKEGYYGGLWDLPGGGVDFGETPEKALRREFLEEVGMEFTSMELISNLSHRGINKEENYDFHHVGMIYQVDGITEVKGSIPEETFFWQSLDGLDLKKLTPLTRAAIELL